MSANLAIKNSSEKIEPRTGLRLIGSRNSSTLDTTVQTTYQPAYLLGYGFDKVKASITNKALKEFDVIRVKTQDSTTDIRSVTTSDEMETELSAALKGDFKIDGVNIGVDSQYIHKLKASTNSMSIIAEYNVMDSGYSQAPLSDYQLTDEAKQYFEDEGEKKFQERYGEYFVSGYQYGSKFYGIYTCSTESSEKFDEFKLKLTASMPDLFSAEGSVAFSNLVKSLEIKVEVQIAMAGYTGTPPGIKITPETILELLEWFQGHAVGEPMATMFMSYSTILPEYTNTIDISPDVFTLVSMTYSNYWLIVFLYNSVPPYYQNFYRTLYETVTIGIETNFTNFINNPRLLNQSYLESQNFIVTLQTILSDEQFYNDVKDSITAYPEPETNEKVYESAINVRSYGSTAPSINSSTFSDPIKKDWEVGWVNQNFNWSDSERVIVGWRVSSNKTKNGYWEKKTNGTATLGSELALLFTSDYDRGIDYTVEVWSVLKSTFNFS